MIFDRLFYLWHVLDERYPTGGASPASISLLAVYLILFALVSIFAGIASYFGFTIGNDALLLTTVFLFLVILWYYYRKGKMKLIVEKYEAREKANPSKIHPLIKAILYALVSLALCIIAGMFRNRDYIFSN